MAYINTVPEPGEGEVAEQYRRSANPQGQVAEVVKVFSGKPSLLKLFLDFSNVTSFGGTSLGHRREEMISTYVSYLNRCFY